MPREFPGWIALPIAAEKYGVDYAVLRRLTADGTLTRGRFTSEKPGAPIYLRVDELDAWKSEGIPGVRRVQAANKAELESIIAPVLGGESGA